MGVGPQHHRVHVLRGARVLAVAEQGGGRACRRRPGAARPQGGAGGRGASPAAALRDPPHTAHQKPQERATARAPGAPLGRRPPGGPPGTPLASSNVRVRGRRGEPATARPGPFALAARATDTRVCCLLCPPGRPFGLPVAAAGPAACEARLASATVVREAVPCGEDFLFWRGRSQDRLSWVPLHCAALHASQQARHCAIDDAAVAQRAAGLLHYRPRAASLAGRGPLSKACPALDPLQTPTRRSPGCPSWHARFS